MINETQSNGVSLTNIKAEGSSFFKSCDLTSLVRSADQDGQYEMEHFELK